MERVQRGERGASIVEFALVFPLLLSLVFGIVETNIGFFGAHQTAQALANATRLGSIARDDPGADATIISAVRKIRPPGVTLESVTIYRAEQLDADAPTVCNATTSCTIYTADALAAGTSWTKCADEHGGICVFDGTETVRYGANGVWTTKSVTGPVACENSVFGDPLHGVVKACYRQTFIPPNCTSYCPAERRPYDLLGVAVRMRYRGVSGFIPFRFTFVRHAVSPIEPNVV